MLQLGLIKIDCIKQSEVFNLEKSYQLPMLKLLSILCPIFIGVYPPSDYLFASHIIAILGFVFSIISVKRNPDLFGKIILIINLIILTIFVVTDLLILLRTF